MTAARATAIVIGGGIGGLCAAIALRDAGWQVRLHESASRFDPAGTALSLWPNAIAGLRMLNAADAIEREAAPIATMLMARADGRPIIGPLGIGREARLVTRTLLHRALLDAADGIALHLASRVVEVIDEPDNAVAVLADGEGVSADLVVDASGIWSPIADRHIGNKPAPTGYGGVLALSDGVGDDGHDGAVAEYWGERERFGLCDVGGGHRYWFYMHGDPAVDLSRATLLRRADRFPAAIGAAIAATPVRRLVATAIHARAVPRRLGRGRIISIGDAAHAMEPNLGQGACQAIEDAVALGAIAKRGIAPADMLGTFERTRLSRIGGFMRRSREGGMAAHGNFPRGALLRAGLPLIPEWMHARMIGAMHRLPRY